MEISINVNICNIIDNSLKLIHNKKNDYYNDVLIFLNLIFCDNSNTITRIKFNNISINEFIFELYNNIINKYQLDKDLFDIKNFNIDNFDLNIPEHKNMIFKIVLKLSNNLLDKLDLKLKIIKNKYTDKNIFILQHI